MCIPGAGLSVATALAALTLSAHGAHAGELLAEPALGVGSLQVRFCRVRTQLHCISVPLLKAKVADWFY
jgi:hypothetical protein